MLIKKRGSKKPLNIILMVYLHDLTEDRGTDTYERPTIEMIPNFLVFTLGLDLYESFAHTPITPSLKLNHKI